MSCVNITKRAWPQFKERESIYHIFCKHFSNTSFVAVRQGDVVGFLLGFISQVKAGHGYIHLVATDPRNQRQGIATALYEKFFRTTKKKGVRHVSLIVNPDNVASLRFHERLGFRTNLSGALITVAGVEAVKDYNGQGNHMVPFTKEI